MFQADNPGASLSYVPSFETAARSLKVEPIIASVHSDVEIETAITALGREPGGGLVVIAGGSTAGILAPIIAAAARNNVPAVYGHSVWPRDGGLLSYGPVSYGPVSYGPDTRDPRDTWRRVASYVDRILRGDKPGDLPVQFPTKFEMVVNRKTAKALGLAIPPSILLRADEVIE
jgi:putative ABC transport system substrate-binding protein